MSTIRRFGVLALAAGFAFAAPAIAAGPKTKAPAKSAPIVQLEQDVGVFCNDTAQALQVVEAIDGGTALGAAVVQVNTDLKSAVCGFAHVAIVRGEVLQEIQKAKFIATVQKVTLYLVLRADGVVVHMTPPADQIAIFFKPNETI